MATRNPQISPGTTQPTIPCSELSQPPCSQGSQLYLALAAAQILIPEEHQLTTACMGHYTDVYKFFQKDHAKPYTPFWPWPRI